MSLYVNDFLMSPFVLQPRTARLAAVGPMVFTDLDHAIVTTQTRWTSTASHAEYSLTALNLVNCHAV
jgi:hypothetical protein